MRLPFSILSIIRICTCALEDEGQSETDVRLTAPKELRNRVDARAGTGDPVHRIADGGVYAYPCQLIPFRMVDGKNYGDAAGWAK